MTIEATTAMEYREAFSGLWSRAIVGSYRIGELYLAVGTRNWVLYDDHGNQWVGSCKNSALKARQAIDRASEQWIASKFRIG